MNYHLRAWAISLGTVATACGADPSTGDDDQPSGLSWADTEATTGGSDGGSSSGADASADASATLSTSVSASTTFTTGDDADSGDDSSGDPSGDPTGDEAGTAAETTGAQPGCEGLGAAGLLLWTTLDDAASVASPTIGAGAGTIATAPADDFVAALDGDGVRLDALDERVLFPQSSGGTSNVDLSRGTIDLCYRPDFDHFDSLSHEIFGTSPVDSAWLRVRKAGGNNQNGFNVIARDTADTTAEFLAPSTDYSLSSGVWYRVTVSWDFTVAPGQQNIRVYLDGQELSDATPPTGPLQMPAVSSEGTITIGAYGTGVANAVIDDFKLYDDALAP